MIPIDVLGNEINCGDHVVFTAWSRTDLMFGTVKQYAPAQSIVITLESGTDQPIHISNNNTVGGLMVLGDNRL